MHHFQRLLIILNERLANVWKPLLSTAYVPAVCPENPNSGNESDVLVRQLPEGTGSDTTGRSVHTPHRHKQDDERDLHPSVKDRRKHRKRRV